MGKLQSNRKPSESPLQGEKQETPQERAQRLLKEVERLTGKTVSVSEPKLGDKMRRIEMVFENDSKTLVTLKHVPFDPNGQSRTDRNVMYLASGQRYYDISTQCEDGVPYRIGVNVAKPLWRK